MNKKIIIALVVVIAILAIGVFVLLGNTDKTISYDNTLNITLPSHFNTTEENGNVTEAFPEDKSYIVGVDHETDIKASNIDSNWTYIKDATSMLGENMTFKEYSIGNYKYYDATITGRDYIKDIFPVDAQKLRFVDIVFPGVEKVYTVFFVTNDTSLDLDNGDIRSIINSTATSNN
jgi:hypothetical protein